MEKIRNKKFILLFGIISLAILTILSFAYTKRLIIAEQKAVIGKLYEQSPDACELLLGNMFEITGSQAEQEAGEAALTELGYTGLGAEYLYRESAIPQLHTAILFPLLLIIFMVLFTLFSLEEQQRKDAERLAADIGTCITSQTELQASQYSCNPTLVNRILEILKALFAKEQELKEKNHHTQNFVENIAHQIKTPLSCISFSLDMLLTEAKDAQQKERIQHSFVYLKEIEGLMRMLLDIGRLEAGKLIMKKTAIRFEELLEECTLLLDSENKQFCIETEYENGAHRDYYGDYDWLKEAFSNILKNCLEHDNSNIPIHVKLTQKRESIFIHIKDHGSGILPEDLEHIFDRFYIPASAKRSHTGIGLNLAELVIRKHFGIIEAFNHEDGGAVFSIVLPSYGLKNEKF